MIRGLSGKYPTIHPTAFVSEFAYVVGDVKIGANSSIWPGVVLRSDRGTMTIGQGTNIGPRCDLSCKIRREPLLTRK